MTAVIRLSAWLAFVLALAALIAGLVIAGWMLRGVVA